MAAPPFADKSTAICTRQDSRKWFRKGDGERVVSPTGRVPWAFPHNAFPVAGWYSGILGLNHCPRSIYASRAAHGRGCLTAESFPKASDTFQVGACAIGAGSDCAVICTGVPGYCVTTISACNRSIHGGSSIDIERSIDLGVFVNAYIAGSQIDDIGRRGRKPVSLYGASGYYVGGGKIDNITALCEYVT